MVCKDDHYPSFVMMMTNVGSIIGTPIYGTLSDRMGRKPVFFIVILVTAMTAISSILMTNFTAFLVLRTINGSLMPSVFQLPFIIREYEPVPNPPLALNIFCSTKGRIICLILINLSRKE
ncbi:hypothetical protein AVEN_205800-1 [Araneus ventricosus]|uniref:Major facilitator superfamily (MFS) profile domain-containing protein n=1 Tax=Araneus ventricosus TaxID=182803 RepID=A0A4Y2SZU3_ARAVE|nr:hypothetical protein AVEN_91590-1 [Araneus ventricosus]GBN93938.1 hypothetical protein AVEN_11724-1 [Araneus ventricosus]GBN94011.1 hypothetical protein AVEN_147918-1 [Araneus ventricosus]GBN94019.1 hypothetical protein AVEN_205800-1 [Araneus ventricosus]